MGVPAGSKETAKRRTEMIRTVGPTLSNGTKGRLTVGSCIDISGDPVTETCLSLVADGVRSA